MPLRQRDINRGSYMITDKTDEDRMNHFISRLKERYDVDMSEKEYWDICDFISCGPPSHKKHDKKYTFFCKLSSVKSICILKIKEEDVVVIYSSIHKMLITALPKSTISEIERLVPIFVKRKKMEKEFCDEYNNILNKCNAEYVDFGDKKKNWKHYEDKCAYPELLIKKYTNQLTVRNIIWQVMMNLFGMTYKEAKKYS